MFAFLIRLEIKWFDEPLSRVLFGVEHALLVLLFIWVSYLAGMTFSILCFVFSKANKVIIYESKRLQNVQKSWGESF